MGGGLRDLSRIPHHLARAIAEPVAAELLRLRLEQPLEGPLKLQANLKQLHPQWEIPAPSTIGELLKRHGLVKSRQRRRQWPHPLADLTPARAPNEVWATDCKGWFRTGDGQRCDPLTITVVLALPAALPAGASAGQQQLRADFRSHLQGVRDARGDPLR